MKKMSAKDLTLAALGAVIITISSYLTIPSTIPFTMQTFGVFCVLLVLGGKRGTLSVLIYIIMGMVGLPVFSGFKGGLVNLVGPTGGYIIGFLATGIVYLILEKFANKKDINKVIVLTIGLILCYLLGTIWFVVVATSRGGSYTMISALTLCVVPYIIPDLLKMYLALIISKRIKKSVKELD